MTDWKGKSKGTPFGYKIFIFLINNFGLGSAYFILRFVALYFFLFSVHDRKITFWYFSNIHKFGYWKSLWHCYKNFYAVGLVLLDKAYFFSGSNKQFSFIFEGENHLFDLAKNGKGGIIVGAHIGNWEIAGQLMDRIDSKVNIVMKIGERQEIREVMEKIQVNKKMNIIDISDDFSYLIEIKKALDNNEFVIMHGDRFTDKSNAIEMEFMNRTAFFPTGPFYLATKFKKPIIFAFAMKESAKRYHFYASKPIYNDDYLDKNKTRIRQKKLLQKYIDELEIMIKTYPDQWFNFYRFWTK